MELPQCISDLFERGATDVLIAGEGFAQADFGSGLERVGLDLGNSEQLRELAISWAYAAGARADIAKPISDFNLGGFRIQIVLPYSVAEQTLIHIRSHPSTPVSLDVLRELGMLTSHQAQLLTRAVANSNSVLVTGPTGSGKTTLLAALVAQSGRRAISIEQTPELNLPLPAIQLFEREANQDGQGRIDASQLLFHSLRMRPDLLVLGEARGADFGALLLALNNGHPAMATLHCSSAEALPGRLMVLGKLAGFDKALTEQLLLAVDLVVQLAAGPRRKISLIGSLQIAQDSLEVRELEL